MKGGTVGTACGVGNVTVTGEGETGASSVGGKAPVVESWGEGGLGNAGEGDVEDGAGNWEGGGLDAV